ncbi:MAG: ATP-binding protein [Eubacteriales bacterium]|nr:ATP-binding protein [Oscillospiraceae bacterium]MDD4493654.1 ATP-binding protein [Eubacteriales bacterium]
MYIKRHIEPVVARIAKRKPVLVLTGARQVGKSTMLKEVYNNVNYVALNRPLVRESARENPSLFFDTYKPPIIVDEIQKAAELFDYIKDIVDENKIKGQFYLTGAQSLKLMKNVSDSLAGRAGVIKLMGLSMRELVGSLYRKPFIPTVQHMESTGSRAGFDYNAITSLIHKGSFPELHETKSDLHDWADFHSSYLQTYIEKDIKDVLNIQDESAFIKFVKSAASLTGEMLNLTTMAEICGKDVKTIKSWLSVLESSGLVYLLEPYYNNFNKRLIKTPKLYFLDTGLACWLLGWNTPEQLVNGAMWGHIFESFVFAEILKSYYNNGIVKPPLYYYRDADKNEIDLLIENGDSLHPVEIKTASDPTKTMVKSFRCLNNNKAKKVGTGAVICLAKERLPLTEDVWTLPIGMI